MQSTKRLWEEIVERHGQTNAPQLFALKKELSEFQQNNLSVGEYYCKLKELWDQITELEEIPECACGAMAKCVCSVMKRMVEIENNNRLMKFLMSLNTGYDQMKTNFLGMDPLLPVNKVYNLVLQVEKQKQITGEISLGNEMSAMAANRQPQSLGPLLNFNKKEYKKMRIEKIEKDAKRSEHCGMKGHLREECFKLVGYPEWFKNNPKGKGSMRQAANVTKNSENYAGEEPLSFVEHKTESSGEKLTTLLQEMLKAMGEKQNA
ncbi:uncharacterized protein [Spinacia oleracea]|uniref:Retrotransposon gag domain-containing protein n=1 Tax=Spinacia oleracea TaxID=3562 RepID=A0ABM3QZA0_SPIOL|nr:uncharacterized protein LOC130463547 [Spinacia oleracea]